MRGHLAIMTRMQSPGLLIGSKILFRGDFRLLFGLNRISYSFAKTLCTRLSSFKLGRGRPLSKNLKNMAWSIRSSADGNGLNSSSRDDSNSGTRLFRAFEAIQVKVYTRIKELRNNLLIKILFFLVGFYCSTAFATVIGQTGDWDILSAALAVAVVEAIGALMYKGSLPFIDKFRNLITIFNYWKAGLTLGLFLDSFKY